MRHLKTRSDRLPILRKALSFKDGPEKGSLEAALHLLQMPASLCGLFQIVSHVDQILSLLPIVAPEANDCFHDINRFCKSVMGISKSDPIRREDLLTKAHLEKEGNGVSSVRPPLTGLYTDYPVWCALWYCSGTRDHEQRDSAYRVLQAHYLGAWLRLQIDEKELKRPKRLYEVGLLLRTIHRPEYGDELDRLHANVMDRGILYERLQWLHSNGREKLRQGYGAFADLLNEAHRMGRSSVFRERAQGKALRHGHRHRKTDLNRLYSNHAGFWRLVEPGSKVPEQDWVMIGLELWQPDSPLAEHLSESGIEPEEYSEPGTFWVDAEGLIDPSEDLGELPPLGSLFAIARARARHLAMDVQRFTTRWSRVRIYTFFQIMKVLDEAFGKAREQRTAAHLKSVKDVLDIRLETIQLAAVALVTGTSPDKLRKLPEYRSASELPSDYVLSYETSHGVWLRPYIPPSRNPLAERFTSYTVDTWPRVVLSDVWGVGHSLPEVKGKSWFERRLKTYEKAFGEYVSPILESLGVDCRWRSLDSMGDILPSWFVGREEGDHLRTAIIFGRDDRLANTQRYYTAFERNGLNEYYAEEMNSLWKRVRDNGFNPSSDLFSLRKRTDIPLTLTGNDRVPRVESIKTLIGKLYQNQQTAHKNAAIEERVEMHNNLVLYTALGMALVTGFRTVRTPVPDLLAYDISTGLMCLQEKDRKDGSHARIVWLPERIRAQISMYLGQLKRLYKDFPDAWPRELLVKASKHRDYSMYDSEEYRLQLDRTFFFLEPDGDGRWNPLEFTGQEFQRRLNAASQDRWPIPNAGRHFLRSYLEHVGCPSTLINAHFGHWSYGEEVWGPNSSFDPVQYKSSISPYLEKLLDILGYRMVSI